MILSKENCVATLQHLIASTLAPGRGIPTNEFIGELKAGDDFRNGPAALDSLDQLTVARGAAEFFELEKAGIEEFLLRRSRLEQWSELIVENLNDGTLTQLSFRSGGTTGEPKLVPQAITHLVSEAREIGRLTRGVKRIVALVPLHHIYGFIWGPLLSDQLGMPLVHGPEAVAVAHGGLQPGDLLLGVPEWWQYLAGSRIRLPGGVTGVTSTAPCPPQAVQDMLAGGLESMIEVYGSSETAGIGWRDDTQGEFRLFEHWHRRDDDHIESSQGGVYRLPDHVRWGADRSLVPVARRDHAVQVGGINVWPDRIGAYIENHRLVKACAVRPMETEHGTRLKLFVVPADAEADDVRPEMRAWINTSLPAAERPIHLTVGAKLPRDSLGKLCDW